METREIWNQYHEEFYFFILKRVKNKDTAKDILQTSFLKIHKNLNNLKDSGKIKSWCFQIIRNEIINNFNTENHIKSESELNYLSLEPEASPLEKVCCFDKFLNELPKEYQELMKLVYVEGKPQKEAAQLMEISLANTKARIRRAKYMLKKQFQKCCKFEINQHGKLVGNSKCVQCE